MRLYSGGTDESRSKNAREAAEGTDTKIGLDIGPIGRLLEPNGSLSFEEAYEIFKLQVEAGSDADVILIETMTDLYEMKAAVLAAKENDKTGEPVARASRAKRGDLGGREVRGMALTLEGLGVDAIGMNCSLGPAEFKPLIEELSKWTTLPIVSKSHCRPAKSGHRGIRRGRQSSFAKLTADLIPHGVKAVGGCCGTTPGVHQSHS